MCLQRSIMLVDNQKRMDRWMVVSWRSKTSVKTETSIPNVWGDNQENSVEEVGYSWLFGISTLPLVRICCLHCHQVKTMFLCFSFVGFRLWLMSRSYIVSLSSALTVAGVCSARNQTIINTILTIWKHYIFCLVWKIRHF